MRNRVVMKITKLNYELYIIDYIEGTLQSGSKLLFDEFLSLHPEVKKEISDYLQAPVLKEDVSIVMPAKDSLLKTESYNKFWPLSLIVIIILSGVVYQNYFHKVAQDFEILNSAQKMNIAQNQVQPMASATTTSDKTTELNNTKVVAVAPTKKASPSIAIEKKIKPIAKKAAVVTPRKPTPLMAEAAITKMPAPVIASQIENRKIEKLSPLEIQDSEPVVSLYSDGLLSDNIQMVFLIQSESSYVANDPKKSWWSLLTPRAYKNIDLKNAFSSSSLSAVIGDTNSK